jgi:UDP:flavonoid glycosyltransferase YjiC (YdhE family)
MPMHRMSDQPMIGKAVVAAGAGRVLPKTASVEDIRSAVRSLLQEPSYRQAAVAVGARLRSQNGVNAAADELESLLKAHKDSARPAA